MSETDKLPTGNNPSILKFTPERVLEFNVTGGSQSHVVLQLENPSDSNVAFKIKTTAPKSYLVKPSSGVVLPHSKQDVNILLIPMYEPPRDSSPDRFLVQSTVIPTSEPLTKEEWSELSHIKERLEERRLSVNLNWLGFAAGLTGKADMSDTLHNIIGRTPPVEHNELKAKYEELIAYSIAAEKQKKELEAQLDELRTKGGVNAPDSHGKSSSGMEYWQVGLLLLFVLLAFKALQI
eukprot:Gregarina_sp_Poly_1__4096@NODE_2247_length_2415_cov_282_563458_g1443_i0_p2_GENE_NODE_2247_length_2415_cov_282_563458_g1443_i0NODE_2247_length_2415_cov_282_563458_g1443_i0_p2_ORF_typecomplete_len236_score37_31Motile_Sperm/PF00635_26/1_2e27PapDlike/PF14874_6/0_00045Myosin_tail_1/PF01576_19/0_0061HALZ/PF02183_18/0_026DUF5001/PF16392_5/0_22CAMSAP_CC1/PF17095_5/2CAMSAP_CC1/PF17095_5/88_NODE_2247_length_2415_cov_282_563458_g1443_i088795